MLTAKEARDLTSKNIKTNVDRALREIEHGIRNYALDGVTAYSWHCNYSSIILAKVKTELELCGYTVSVPNMPNSDPLKSDRWLIRWEE